MRLVFNSVAFSLSIHLGYVLFSQQKLKFLHLTQFCSKIVELGTPERVWLLNIGFPELITSTNIVVAPEKA